MGTATRSQPFQRAMLARMFDPFDDEDEDEGVDLDAPGAVPPPAPEPVTVAAPAHIVTPPPAPSTVEGLTLADLFRIADELALQGYSGESHLKAAVSDAGYIVAITPE